MVEDPKPRTLQEEIARAIETGKVKMKPRWHFVLRGAAVLAGAIFLALALLYLVSFIVFSLRQSGALFTPAFGWRGVVVLLSSLPWLLVLSAAVLAVLLEVLVRRYQFSYGRPLLYTVLGVAALAVAGGILVERTAVHRTLLLKAQRDRLPFGARLYRGYGMSRPKNVVVGMITTLTPSGCRLRGPGGQDLTVTFTPKTVFPPGSDFTPGDTVVVFGEPGGGGITAFGVKEVTGQLQESRRTLFPAPPGAVRLR